MSFYVFFLKLNNLRIKYVLIIDTAEKAKLISDASLAVGSKPHRGIIVRVTSTEIIYPADTLMTASLKLSVLDCFTDLISL